MLKCVKCVLHMKEQKLPAGLLLRFRDTNHAQTRARTHALTMHKYTQEN